MSWAEDWWRRSCVRRPSRPRAPPCAHFRVPLLPQKADRRVARQPDDALMLFADSEDENNLWFLYRYSWGGRPASMQSHFVRHPRRRPRPRPGRLGQQLRLLPCTQNPGAWLKPRPTGAWQAAGSSSSRLTRPSTSSTTTRSSATPTGIHRSSFRQLYERHAHACVFPHSTRVDRVLR